MERIAIDELKKMELNILDFFVQVCEDHALSYFLSGGTLLGAIRHNGFIPWDDDIDVMMPRKDYERLKEVFPDHPYYKFLYHGNTHNYPKPFGTINDVRTYKPENNIRNKCRYILGVNIDVFPIDELPASKDDRHQYFMELSQIAHKLYCITYSYKKSWTLWLTIKRFLGISFYRCLESCNVVSINDIVCNYDMLARKYNGSHSGMCGVTTIDNYGEKEANVTKDYYPIKRIRFEGKEYNIPANYDTYLQGLYGDYMQLPPIEKRVAHHADCYWR